MNISENFSKYDAAEYLRTEEQIENYLAMAKESKDPVIYEQACEVAERAKKKLSSNQFKPCTVLHPKNK